MDKMKIRSEEKKDLEAIADVHDRAFNGKGEGLLVNLIRKSDAFVPELSIVAESDGKIVGHVLISKISLIENGQDLKSLSLAPVAVTPELQGRGIGRKLIEEGILRARVQGFTSILVLGNPVYYGRFGFTHELVANIRCRYFCKDFAGVELQPNSLKNLKNASATYPEAFSAVD